MRKIYYSLKSLLWHLIGKRIPDTKTAIKMGLTHNSNIHGDLINILNCRSIWVDKYDNTYYCLGLLMLNGGKLNEN
jgi:hypothetical protein